VTANALCDREAPPDRLGGARIALEKVLTDANHVGFYADEIGLTDEHASTSSTRSPICP
jgi:hypothetical protein